MKTKKNEIKDLELLIKVLNSRNKEESEKNFTAYFQFIYNELMIRLTQENKTISSLQADAIFYEILLTGKEMIFERSENTERVKTLKEKLSCFDYVKPIVRITDPKPVEIIPFKFRPWLKAVENWNEEAIKFNLTYADSNNSILLPSDVKPFNTKYKGLLDGGRKAKGYFNDKLRGKVFRITDMIAHIDELILSNNVDMRLLGRLRLPTFRIFRSFARKHFKTKPIDADTLYQATEEEDILEKEYCSKEGKLVLTEGESSENIEAVKHRLRAPMRMAEEKLAQTVDRTERKRCNQKIAKLNAKYDMYVEIIELMKEKKQHFISPAN